MAKKTTTISEYIEAAPSHAQPHLRKLYKILKSVAPQAEETIKWGVPFFVEPRFLFSFSAFKAHCVLAPTQAALEAFPEELAHHKTTKNFLQIPYNTPVPEELVRKLAQFCVQQLAARETDSFW